MQHLNNCIEKFLDVYHKYLYIYSCNNFKKHTVLFLSYILAAFGIKTEYT